jgi:hypothetical protein
MHKNSWCSKRPSRQTNLPQTKVVLTISTMVVKHQAITPSLIRNKNLAQCIVIWSRNRDLFGPSLCPSQEQTKNGNHSDSVECTKMLQRTSILQIGPTTEWAWIKWPTWRTRRLTGELHAVFPDTDSTSTLTTCELFSQILISWVNFWVNARKSIILVSWNRVAQNAPRTGGKVTAILHTFMQVSIIAHVM